MPKKIGITIFICVAVGLAMYMTIYWLSSNGEAYKFVEQKIRSSAAIATEIGTLQRVRLSPFGPYDDKMAGSDERASMTVDVSGAKKTIVLDIRVKKEKNIWEIEDARFNGKLISLD